MRKLIATLAAIGLSAGLAACGETEQVVVYEQGKYQGKPDSRPWDNEPAAQALRGGTWTKGDQASWESQIKSRQLAQHEHKRIYQ
jgi:hypothetical protein